MGPGAGGWLGRVGKASQHTEPPPLILWMQRPPCQGRKDLWGEGNYRAAGVTQVKGLEEARAEGSSYPLWCRSPGADVATPPKGKKIKPGLVISHLQLDLCRIPAQRAPEKESIGEFLLLEQNTQPMSQPSPPILLRDSCFL